MIVCINVMRRTKWILVTDNDRKLKGYILNSRRSITHGVYFSCCLKIYHINLICGDLKYPKSNNVCNPANSIVILICKGSCELIITRRRRLKGKKYYFILKIHNYEMKYWSDIVALSDIRRINKFEVLEYSLRMWIKLKVEI